MVDPEESKPNLLWLLGGVVGVALATAGLLSVLDDGEGQGPEVHSQRTPTARRGVRQTSGSGMSLSEPAERIGNRQPVGVPPDAGVTAVASPNREETPTPPPIPASRRPVQALPDIPALQPRAPTRPIPLQERLRMARAFGPALDEHIDTMRMRMRQAEESGNTDRARAFERAIERAENSRREYEARVNDMEQELDEGEARAASEEPGFTEEEQSPEPLSEK